MDTTTKIIQVIGTPGYEEYLHRCLTAITKRKYSKRIHYLEEAIPKGLRKEMLFVEGDAVGMIEYAPCEASVYPIMGSNLWVMNCIWVLRRAGGHNYGKALMTRMKEKIINAGSVATIALEGHYSPWFRLPQIEHLGFRSVDSRRLRHRAKHRDVCFGVHLMWMPLDPGAETPEMDWEKMLQGVDFCIAHPLYRAESLGLVQPFETC